MLSEAKRSRRIPRNCCSVLPRDFSTSLGRRSSYLSFIASSLDIRASSFSPHLPVFHEGIWNLLQKARWPLKHVAVAATQTHVRIGKIKLIAGACDRHVKQAPFFFEGIAGI